MQFGCNVSKYDSRDYKLKSDIVSKSNLPEEFILPVEDLRIKNQTNVSSCVAHATSSILEYHTNPHKNLSTNFIYGIQKLLFNSTTEGMCLREACKIAADYGDMLEDDCPGNTEVPKCYEVAEDALYDDDKVTRASEYRISKYFLCLTNDDIKYALYKHGPVLASIKWYNTYRVNTKGILEGDQKGSHGGHAVMVYGYNKDGFLCQNSWGRGWGRSGRFILPYSIKFREARGLVDWNGTDELREPSTGGLWNIIYKLLNGLANIVYNLINKNN